MKYFFKVLSVVMAVFTFALAPVAARAGANAGTYNGALRLAKQVGVANRSSTALSQVQVQPGDMVEFRITVWSVAGPVTDVVVTDEFNYQSLQYEPNSLLVNGTPSAPGLSSGGLRFPSVGAQPTVITYRATVVSNPGGSSQAVARATAANGHWAQNYTVLEMAGGAVTGSSSSFTAANPNPVYDPNPPGTFQDYVSYTPLPPSPQTTVPRTTTAPPPQFTNAPGQFPQDRLVSPEVGTNYLTAIFFAGLLTVAFVVVRHRNKLLTYMKA